MLFDWDDEKRDTTLRERGIDFIDAAMVWADPRRQERYDMRRDYAEKRIQAIGRVSFGVLFVVYTERVNRDGEDVVRIISARKASRKEREEYEAGTFPLRKIV